MYKGVAFILLGLSLSALGACHTDPFSVKPEVNVELPKGETVPTEDNADDASDTESDATL